MTERETMNCAGKHPGEHWTREAECGVNAPHHPHAFRPKPEPLPDDAPPEFPAPRDLSPAEHVMAAAIDAALAGRPWILVDITPDGTGSATTQVTAGNLPADRVAHMLAQVVRNIEGGA